MKSGLDKRGVRNPFAQAPAVVTNVSWPSFAENPFTDEAERDKTDMDTYVWRDKHPFGQRICISILIEHCKVLDLRKTVRD